jgi:hypothetical protein
MNRRHEGVENAGILALTGPLLKSPKQCERILADQLARPFNADHPQVGGHGLADVGQLIKSRDGCSLRIFHLSLSSSRCCQLIFSATPATKQNMVAQRCAAIYAKIILTCNLSLCNFNQNSFTCGDFTMWGWMTTDRTTNKKFLPVAGIIHHPRIARSASDQFSPPCLFTLK